MRADSLTNMELISNRLPTIALNYVAHKPGGTAMAFHEKTCANHPLASVVFRRVYTEHLRPFELTQTMPPPAPRLRVRLYLWLDRWLQRWVRLLGILHEGFWLGCFDPDDLTAVTIRSYQESHVYSGREHNQSGLFPWEREAIDRFFRPNSQILVAACGGGREMIALHNLGFQADGFDCTPRLVETSRGLLSQLGISSNVVLCPPNEVPGDLTPHDGLIVGWTAYMQIPGRARRIAFLRKLRSSVPPGAPLLVSFWVEEGAAPDAARVFRLAKWLRSLRGRRAEPLEPGDHVTSRGYHHCFAKEEIEAELKVGGFRMCHYCQADHPYAVGVAE
jgi:hypothetical protein